MEIGIIVLFGVILIWVISAKGHYQSLDVFVETFEEDLYELTKRRMNLLKSACESQGIVFVFPKLSHDVIELSDTNELLDVAEKLIQKDEVLSDALSDNARDIKRASRFYNHMAKKYNKALLVTPNYLLAGTRTVKMPFVV